MSQLDIYSAMILILRVAFFSKKLANFGPLKFAMVLWSWICKQLDKAWTVCIHFYVCGTFYNSLKISKNSCLFVFLCQNEDVECCHQNNFGLDTSLRWHMACFSSAYHQIKEFVSHFVPLPYIWAIQNMHSPHRSPLT